MPIKGADADTGRSRDGFEAGVRTTSTENLSCSLEHTLAVPNRIGARLSRPFPRLPHVERRISAP